MPLVQSVLVVDPDTDFLEWVETQLNAQGVKVLTASDSEKAYQLFLKNKPDVVLAETHIKPLGGMDLLAKIRHRDSNAIVVLMSAFGTTQAVIEAMRLGAFDFIRKQQLPFTLKVVIDSALKAQSDMKAATSAKPALTVEEHQDSLVGK